MDGISLL